MEMIMSKFLFIFRNLDCVYMHLLFPGEENENMYTNEKKKDIFYEVGCKIFEINKIFR